MNDLMILENRTLSLVNLDNRWSAGTYKNFLGKVKVYNKFLEENQSANLFDFFDMLKASKRLTTVHNYRDALKAAYRQELRRQGRDTIENITYLDTVFKNIKPGKINKKISTEKIMRPDELVDFYKHAGTKTRLIGQALYWTGSRVSELINIKFADCTIRDKGVIIRIVGKGTKERTVFMPADLFIEIKETYNGKIYLFETAKGKPIGRRGVYILTKRVGCKIGRSDAHPHTFRHSFASNKLASKELNVFEVQDYLGHADIRTTGMYVHTKANMNKILQGAN